MFEGDVLVAIVTTTGLILVAIITNRTRQHAKASRVQLENEHKNPDGSVINLREEADGRHLENREGIRALYDLAKATQSDVRGLRRDIGRLADADARHDERWLELERTQPNRRKMNEDE